MDKPKLNKDAISQKISETARETKRLKQELEALISAGIRGTIPLQASTSQADSTNRVQIIKSYDSVRKQLETPNDHLDIGNEARALSQNKPKAYDADEAREYIKRQRQKRRDEVKNQNTCVQIAADIRKEKLKELKQKASEIVKKNIEAKRSKSQDPPIVRSMSATGITQQASSASKKTNFGKEKKEVVSETSIISFNCAKRSRKFSPSSSREESHQSSRSKLGKSHSMENVNLAKTEEAKNPNLLYPPPMVYGIRPEIQAECINLEGTGAVRKVLTNAVKKSTIKPSDSTKHQKMPLNITLRSPATHPPLLEHQEGIKKIPDWLKEQPETDPYNFINTVKRQLKYVIKEKNPNFVDVGVQGGLEYVGPASHSSRSSKETDLRSFKSHKCLNLDPKTIEHIKLDRNKDLLAFKDGPTMTKPTSCSENDSDTSKNIPSISSESGSKLRSHPSSLLCVPGQEKIKKKLFVDSDEYSSQFGTSTHRDFSEPRSSTKAHHTKNTKLLSLSSSSSLSRSRESIISSNCATVSPRKPSCLQDAGIAAQDHNNSNKDSILYKNITTRLSAEQSLESKSNQLQFFSLLSTLHPSTINSEFVNTETVETSDTRNKISETVQSGDKPKEGPDSELLDTVRTEVQKSNEITELFSKGDAFTASASPNQVLSSAASEFAILNSPKQPGEKLPKRSMRGLSRSETNIYRLNDQVEKHKLSLNINKRSRSDDRQAAMRNITIRSADQSREDLDNTNQIHLKFEAEIHLLSDFNQTIRRFSEIERTFESLRIPKNTETSQRKDFQTRDTQTSMKSIGGSKSSSVELLETRSRSTTTIVSGVQSDQTTSKLLSQRSDTSPLELTQASDLMTTFNLEDTLPEDAEGEKTSHLSQLGFEDFLSARGDENVVFNTVIGMSLKMFDQMIKDEDARIENWKKVVKVREQALLDRTRGELIWLEMQKKQLIQTGKLSEASLIKKRQRGILLKHQQEKHEMQRLKQMQKNDSQNRKAVLKKERNQIKNQLLEGNTMSKLKLGGHRERRLSGPFKVLQASGPTVHSETSLSRDTAITDQEIRSITGSSRSQSLVNIVSGASDVEQFDLSRRERPNISPGAVLSMRKTLLMREHALAKRRKTVEELLLWHRKLLNEERAIEELESKIGKIITKIPSSQSNETTNKSKTPSAHSSDNDATIASMSQLALERLQPPNTNIVPSKITPNISSEFTPKNIPAEEIHSEDSNRVASSTNYSADFDVESGPQNSDDRSSVSSISQLIEDFSKIEDNLLNSSLNAKLTEDVLNGPQDDTKSEISSRSTEATSRIEAKKIGSEPEDALIIMLDKSIANDIRDKVNSEVESEQLIPNNVPDNDDNTPLLVIVQDKTAPVDSRSSVSDSNLDEDVIIISSEEEGLEISLEQSIEEIKRSPDQTEDSVFVQEFIGTTETENVTLGCQNGKEEPLIDDNFQITDVLEQNEKIGDFTATDIDQPSTSRQHITSPPLSHSSNDDVSNRSQEKDHDSLLSPGVVEIEVQLPNAMEDNRQSSENKTDEEKAASLSCRSSGSSIIEDRSPKASGSKETLASLSEKSSSGVSLAGPETSAIGAVEVSVETDQTCHSTDLMGDNSLNADTSSEVSTIITSPKSPASSSKLSEPTVSNQNPPGDIKQHVQEILNVTSPTSRGDPSPVQSPEPDSPPDDKKTFSLGTEAEELHRKQLAIEQEIKFLKEQQQKEAFYVREIPNKPPPPYLPPSPSKSLKTISVIPATKEEVEQITEYSAKIIHKAYLSNKLDSINISDNTLSLIGKNIDKGCYKYVFDLCKEVAIDHYSQFEEATGPSWLQVDKPAFNPVKPLDVIGLKKLMSEKLLVMFGFEKQETRQETTIMKWSKKKQDHVDEVLVQAMRAEDKNWTNFEKDELSVKDRLTKEIMEMLLKDTAKAVKNSLQKKSESQ